MHVSVKKRKKSKARPQYFQIGNKPAIFKSKNKQKSHSRVLQVLTAIFDEDGTRDAAVTKLNLPRSTFQMRDLHNQLSEIHNFSRFGMV
jgi:hypothetical protein